jgi:hypothetical protein
VAQQRHGRTEATGPPASTQPRTRQQVGEMVGVRALPRCARPRRATAQPTPHRLGLSTDREADQGKGNLEQAGENVNDAFKK